MRSDRFLTWLDRSRWSRQRISWTASLLGLALLGLVSFQNCTQPVPIESGDELASMGEKLSFAYSANIDQIGYMSCSNVDPGMLDASSYFTFRVGAYRNAGLALKDSFFVETDKKAPDLQKEILSYSPLNTNTILQLAIRDINNFQSIRAARGTASVGFDYVNILEPLGTPEMSHVLVDLPMGSRLKYVRNGLVSGARFEGSLYFTQNYATANSIRQLTTNGSYLALTYSNAGDQQGAGSEVLARGPYDGDKTTDSNRSIYGAGFSFRFGQPNASPLHAQFPQTVLREVTEYNLENVSDRNGLGAWTCPTSMQFRIVRAGDVAAPGANCRKMPDPAVLTAELQVIRNTLRPEDWWVDMDNRCIIPKKAGSDCYGNAKSVRYTMGDSCDVNGVDGACVHYATVCYRTN